MNEAFDKYIQKVKLLNINGKRKELYDSITDFGKGLIDIASSDNIPITLINNKEIDDLYKSDLSEDDFLEAMIAYSIIIQKIIKQYLFDTNIAQNEIDEIDNYMNKIIQLDITSKRKELYDSFINLGKTIIYLATKEGINIHILNNTEVNDLYNENLTEDDFLEAMIVYSEMVKNAFAEYILEKENIM